MLQRCVTTSHCCQKLAEEDFTGLATLGGGPQVYGNPFVYDEKASILVGEDEGDFSAGALALMYDPPMNDDLDYGSDELHLDGHAQSVTAPKRDGPVGPHIRSSALPQPYAGASNSATRFGPQVEKPWIPSTSAVGPGSSQASTLNPQAAGAAYPSRPSLPQPQSPGKPKQSQTTFGPAQSAPSFGPMSRKAEADSLREEAVVQQTRTQSRSLQKAPAGKGVDQPRTFSRSVRDAQACKSEAGASSIAAILQCVAQAEDIPAQQRPNSEKWSERLNDFSPQKKLE